MALSFFTLWCHTFHCVHCVHCLENLILLDNIRIAMKLSFLAIELMCYMLTRFGKPWLFEFELFSISKMLTDLLTLREYSVFSSSWSGFVLAHQQVYGIIDKRSAGKKSLKLMSKRLYLLWRAHKKAHVVRTIFLYLMTEHKSDCSAYNTVQPLI